jgi:periplasmic protein TonB
MPVKKFLIPFVLASLLGHALLLALTARFDWGSAPQTPQETVLRVELKANPEKKSDPAATRRAVPTAASVRSGGGGSSEDSVSLQGSGSPYEDYLRPIRRKIDRLWSYPSEALARRQEGTALIRFTIEAGGTLTGYHVLTTSGSQLLDEGALAVIRAAAPYPPFPAAFNLSQLHITATFRYRMEP